MNKPTAVLSRAYGISFPAFFNFFYLLDRELFILKCPKRIFAAILEKKTHKIIDKLKLIKSLWGKVLSFVEHYDIELPCMTDLIWSYMIFCILWYCVAFYGLVICIIMALDPDSFGLVLYGKFIES